MSVTAQQGILAFGGQTAMDAVATTFYRHKAVGIDLSPIDDVRLGTPEIGGNSTPTFPYKGGYMAAGGASIFPRLEDTLGWLLYGALGKVTTTVGDGTGDLPETGAYQHEFEHATDDGYLPWMTFRKYIPGSESAEDIGETFEDCKIVSAVLNLANDGPLSMRVDVLGRQWLLEQAPSWSYDNTYETYESIPVGSVVGGYFKIPTFSASELPIVGCSIGIVNAPLDIRQEKVYGDPMLEDITIVGRRVTFDLILKWKDADLYRSMIGNSATATAWSATPFVNDLEVVAMSPDGMPSLTDQYRLKVEAEEVLWQPVGGIQLAAGQSVMMRLQGVAIDNTTNYASFKVDNKESAYTWPS